MAARKATVGNEFSAQFNSRVVSATFKTGRSADGVATGVTGVAFMRGTGFVGFVNDRRVFFFATDRKSKFVSVKR